jgi:pyruvate,water dikinase
MKYIKFFSEISAKDTTLVGGKNANLGEMYNKLADAGMPVPNGFAVTAEGYDYFIKFNNLEEKIHNVLKGLDTHNIEDLHKRGEEIRNLIKSGEFPEDLKNEILSAFQKLKEEYGEDLTVAVRSSATAEDLPGASFAGQQETYLNVSEKDLLEKIKFCFASLFTDRAISYREDKGFDHFKVKLSVAVQKMVRSDVGSSGVMFTIDPDNGCPNVIVINSVFGLGELIVQGKVVPDEFMVFKDADEFPIISKKLGEKNKKIVYAEEGGVKEVETTEEERRMFSLTDEEVRLLAKYGYLIERHYSKAMDIEWAKDGIENKIYIVQARPETVHSTKQNVWYEYRLKTKAEPILKGISIGNQIIAGRVRVIRDVEKIHEFQPGEILVTEMTDPDWEPIMKIAKGIITEKGSRVCHAAIVARELGIPAVVGVSGALEKLKTGDEITIDNSQGLEGKIYQGILEYEVIEHKLEEIPQTKTKVYVNIGEPDEALEKWYLPVKGVGLAREEFIIASEIKIHPNALIDYENLKKKAENYPNNRPNKLPESNDRIESTRIERPNNDIYPNKGPNNLPEYQPNESQKFSPNSGNKFGIDSGSEHSFGPDSGEVFGQNSGNEFGQNSGSDISKIIKKIDELTNGYEDKKQYYIDKLAEGIAKIGVAFWPNEVIVRFSDFKTNEYRNLIGGEIYEPKEENPMIGWRGASRYYHPNFRKAFELEVLAIKKVREEMKLKNIVPMVPFCRTPEEGREVVEIIESILGKREPMRTGNEPMRNDENEPLRIENEPMRTDGVEEILYKDLSYKLVGILYKVKRELGIGHKENIYKNAVEIELKNASIPYIREPSIQVEYDNKVIGVYRPDFIIDDKIIIEVKSVGRLSKECVKQTFHYLKGTKYKLALLVNFGFKDIEIQRIINTKLKSGSQEFVSSSHKFVPYKIYVMCEIPSNVLLADEFLEIFDGMSIGSNDLTQLVLGIDRDNEMLTQIGDERNPAVLKMLEEVIKKCKEKNKYIGICGQAPSDFPEIVEFLVKNKIDSISVNPDAVIKTINLVKEVEEKC